MAKIQIVKDKCKKSLCIFCRYYCAKNSDDKHLLCMLTDDKGLLPLNKKWNKSAYIKAVLEGRIK